MVEKVGLEAFSTIFMIPKTSSKIRGKSRESWQNQLFQRFGPPKRLESWKKLVLTTFPLFPRISEEVFGIIKMVEKVVLANIFHDLGLQNGLSWKKLVLTIHFLGKRSYFFTKMVGKWTTFSTFQREIRGKSGSESCWPFWRPKPTFSTNF